MRDGRVVVDGPPANALDDLDGLEVRVPSG